MAGRICKHEGCGLPAAGRGMCRNHYEVWRRKNPDLIVTRVNERLLLAQMPATVAQLVERTGLCQSAVERALEVLNVGGPGRQAFIYDYIAPARRGKRWEPVYVEGAKPNKRLTDERRREHSLAMNRASYARRAGVQSTAPRASWLDILPVAT